MKKVLFLGIFLGLLSVPFAGFTQSYPYYNYGSYTTGYYGRNAGMPYDYAVPYNTTYPYNGYNYSYNYNYGYNYGYPYGYSGNGYTCAQNYNGYYSGQSSNYYNNYQNGIPPCDSFGPQQGQANVYYVSPVGNS